MLEVLCGNRNDDLPVLRKKYSMTFVKAQEGKLYSLQWNFVVKERDWTQVGI